MVIALCFASCHEDVGIAEGSLVTEHQGQREQVGSDFHFGKMMSVSSEGSDHLQESFASSKYIVDVNAHSMVVKIELALNIICGRKAGCDRSQDRLDFEWMTAPSSECRSYQVRG